MKRILPTLLKALAAGALAAISFNSYAVTKSLVMHSDSSGSNYVAYYLNKTPANAQAYCQSHGGHLAVLNSHAEALDIQGLVDLGDPNSATPAFFWLGSSVAANTSVHDTVTGQAYFLDTQIPIYGDTSPSNATALYEGFQQSTPGNGFYQWYANSSHYYICEFEDAPY